MQLISKNILIIFSETIVHWEKEVYLTLETDLINASIYTFIKTFFYDLRHSNYKSTNYPEMKDFLIIFEKDCIILAKIILYELSYYKYR